MSFFAVLLALVIEQLRPLPRDNSVHDAWSRGTRWIGRNFDAGRDHHAWVVWVLTSGCRPAGVRRALRAGERQPAAGPGLERAWCST
jgi:adenosylcobinamide-phosphate synthase